VLPSNRRAPGETAPKPCDGPPRTCASCAAGRAAIRGRREDVRHIDAGHDGRDAPAAQNGLAARSVEPTVAQVEERREAPGRDRGAPECLGLGAAPAGEAGVLAEDREIEHGSEYGRGLSTQGGYNRRRGR
jgi:hypothetical protein